MTQILITGKSVFRSCSKKDIAELNLKRFSELMSIFERATNIIHLDITKTSLLLKI